MKKLTLAALGLISLSASAATLSITGNDRFGTNLFNNLDLVPGTRTGIGDTTAFLEHRLILRPDVIVDDRFTIRSEFKLAEFPVNPMTGTSTAPNDAPSQFGTPVGNTPMLGLNKVYLDWASDWGVFSVGRMHKNWGLGLLYAGGTDVFDDYATIRDRVAFRALLGNLILNTAYEKANEGRVNDGGDDMDGYELSIEYSNPESLFDVGLLYTRYVAMAAAPVGSASSHNFSGYARKRWDKFQLGGEFANISRSGTAQIGFLGQIDYMPSAWEWSVDVGFASGNKTAPFTFHPNYRPFLLMYNQSVGPKASAASVRGGAGAMSAVGSAFGSGDGSGAFLMKLSGSYGFDNKTLRLGADMGFATLARRGSNDGRMLGVETDFHLTQKWYENFRTVYALGLLFPGAGVRKDAQVGWGLQIRGALNF